ncbi:Uncharacterised protein [Klebsiella pneumoniae]|nr:Uncharacterised protein [Klebsiella pneumoniae]
MIPGGETPVYRYGERESLLPDDTLAETGSLARGGVPALSTTVYIGIIVIPGDIAKSTILKTPIPVKPTGSLAFLP